MDPSSEKDNKRVQAEDGSNKENHAAAAFAASAGTARPLVNNTNTHVQTGAPIVSPTEAVPDKTTAAAAAGVLIQQAPSVQVIRPAAAAATKNDEQSFSADTVSTDLNNNIEEIDVVLPTKWIVERDHLRLLLQKQIQLKEHTRSNCDRHVASKDRVRHLVDIQNVELEGLKTRLKEKESIITESRTQFKALQSLFDEAVASLQEAEAHVEYYQQMEARQVTLKERYHRQRDEARLCQEELAAELEDMCEDLYEARFERDEFHIEAQEVCDENERLSAKLAEMEAAAVACNDSSALGIGRVN